MHLKNIAAMALSLVLLSACGGDAEPADTTDIARDAVLLTAQTYNAADEPVDAALTWTT